MQDQWKAPLCRATLRRARLATIVAIALFGSTSTSVFSARAVAAAPPVPNIARYVGACTFSPLISNPPLVAQFTPNLTDLAGTGVCHGNARATETITIGLSGGNGLTCVGGTETLFGSVTWSDIVPTQHLGISAIATGEGTELQLVFDDVNFTAHGDFTWASIGCPGNLSPALTGSMSFASD